MPTSPLIDYLKVQRATDQQILTALRASAASIESELRRMQSRVGIGAIVRREQLVSVQAAMNREMVRLWTAVGDITEAQKAEAAAIAAEGLIQNSSVLGRLFSKADVDYMARSARQTASRGLEAVERRLEGASYVPLAESVYGNANLASGKVDEIVNSALARGASAAELARDVKAYINPATSGGVRYAAMRLGRTELNNSFHASQVKQALESPWVTAVHWNLSGSHPKPDECNEYAETTHYEGGEIGDFKPEEVPGKPHPNCLCFTTMVDVGVDEFIRQFQAGAYDEKLAVPSVSRDAMDDAVREASPKPPLQGMDSHADLAKGYSKWLDQNASVDQVEALTRYTQVDAYKRWNPYLRGQASAVTEKDLSQIDSLKSLIDQSPPLDSPVAVFRGIQDADAVFGPAMKEGAVFKDDAFMSTTMDGSIRDYYRGTGGDSAIVNINIPEGTRVAVSESQGQLVLSPGTELRVISDRRVMTILDEEGYAMLQADAVENSWTEEYLQQQLERWRVVEWSRVVDAEVI